jgi:autotransporter-associated beta strand protein
LAGNTFELRMLGGGFTFNQPIILGDNSFDTNGALSLLQLDNDSTTSSQIFAGVISESVSLARDALSAGTGGTTILSGANTFSGGVIITGGFIGFGTNTTSTGGNVTSGPVGTGLLEIDNDPSVGLFAYGVPRVVENNLYFNGPTNIQFNDSNDLTLVGGIRVGTVAKTLAVNNTGITTFSGALTNVAPLIKTGGGRLILSGTNVNTGSFTVAAGVLALSGNASISNWPSISVAAGAVLDVSGMNSIFTLGSSQTLSNSASVTGTLNGNLNTGSGMVSISYTNGTP